MPRQYWDSLNCIGSSGNAQVFPEMPDSLNSLRHIQHQSKSTLQSQVQSLLSEINMSCYTDLPASITPQIALHLLDVKKIPT